MLPRHSAATLLILSASLLFGCSTTPPPSADYLASRAVAPVPPKANVNTVDAGTLDPTLTRPPIYPPEMLRQGIEGSVLLEVLVSAEGTLVHTQIISATNEHFAKAAVEAVREWKFYPEVNRGKLQQRRLQFPFKFQLGQ